MHHGNCSFPISDTSDLLDITDYLIDLDQDTIYHLGMVFRLRRAQIEEWRGDPPTFLDNVVSAWLRMEADKGQKPTWRTLIEDLRHKRIRQNGIANKIAKEKLGVEIEFW